MRKIKSDIDLTKLPKIKWSKPTDAELMNEIRTEFHIETLFIDEMWPKAEHYTQALADLKKVSKPEELDPKMIKGRHIWKSYEDLVTTVKSFGGPKEPERMIKAIEDNKPLPMPIVIRRRNSELEILGGATRSGIAALAHQPMMALVIDEKSANEIQANRLEERAILKAKKRGTEDIYNIVKEYFLNDGPNVMFPKEQKFDAYNFAIMFSKIARLRGIKDKAENFMKVVSALQCVIARRDLPDSEMVNLRQLYHGTHDNLKALAPRPISNLDTFGTWLSDHKSATHYGPVVHRVNSDKTVKLASYYDLDELFGGPWKEVYKDSSKLKSLKKDLQRQGFDGVKLSYLDGASGYFVCLWHGDTIPVEVIAKA